MKKIIKLSELLYSMGHKKESKELFQIIKLSEINLDGATRQLEQEIRKSFFQSSSGDYNLIQSLVPSKILSIPKDLQSFAHSKGRRDVVIESNGATRGLKGAIKGGGLRLAGSLHGLGFAHDLIINTKYFTEKFDIGKNKQIIQSDPEIAHIMYEFAEVNNFTWGGNWNIGGKISATHPTNGNTIKVGAGEFHHFELKESDLASNIPAPIRSFMAHIGMSSGDISSSEKRSSLYKKMIEVVEGNALGSSKSTKKLETNESTQPDKEEDSSTNIATSPEKEETDKEKSDGGEQFGKFLGKLFGFIPMDEN